MTRADTVVIGGGLIGVTVAHELLSRGQPVVLIEAREGIALETSYRNGGMLTASMSDPWNAPGVHRHLFASLLDSRSALKLHLSAVPSLLSWGVKFLRNSTAERHWAATLANYRLATYSIRVTRELREDLDLAYDAYTSGSLKVSRDSSSMEGPATLAERLAREGLKYQVLDRDQVVSLEPQLAPICDRISGALYFPDDEGGDAYLFSRCLADSLVASGAEIRTDVVVRQIARGNSGGLVVETNSGRIECECVVVAAGNGSMRLLEPLGISLPVRPAKGYSVTIDAPADPAERPHIGVVDDAMHAAVVPLGSRLRVVGTAEFAGWDLTIRQDRVDNLMNLFRELYPRLAESTDRRTVQPWAGLRPMSADGVPFIGATPVSGVYASVGHGHLGWTLAAGSARLLADIMTGALPAIDASPYAPSRYCRKRWR